MYRRGADRLSRSGEMTPSNGTVRRRRSCDLGHDAGAPAHPAGGANSVASSASNAMVRFDDFVAVPAHREDDRRDLGRARVAQGREVGPDRLLVADDRQFRGGGDALALELVAIVVQAAVAGEGLVDGLLGLAAVGQRDRQPDDNPGGTSTGRAGRLGQPRHDVLVQAPRACQPGDDPVGQFPGHPHHPWAERTDEDRDRRGPGNVEAALDVEEPAVMGNLPGGQQGAENLQVLAHVLGRALEVQAQHPFDDRPVGDTDAEGQSPADQRLHGRRLVGQGVRVARVGGDDADPEFDLGGDQSGRGDRGDRVGAADEVRGPGAREAGVLGGGGRRGHRAWWHGGGQDVAADAQTDSHARIPFPGADVRGVSPRRNRGGRARRGAPLPSSGGPRRGCASVDAGTGRGRPPGRPTGTVRPPGVRGLVRRADSAGNPMRRLPRIGFEASGRARTGTYPDASSASYAPGKAAAGSMRSTPQCGPDLSRRCPVCSLNTRERPRSTGLFFPTRTPMFASNRRADPPRQWSQRLTLRQSVGAGSTTRPTAFGIGGTPASTKVQAKPASRSA